MKKERFNKETGEIASGELNKVIITETIRSNGSVRIQQSFENCPSLAEQHTAHLSDINYLMKKYKPDELASYIAARSQYRQEILGHDFSTEPSLQDGLGIVYQSRQAFEALDPEIKNNFRNHVEFLKFIDNPQNQQRMIKMGLLSRKEIDNIKIPEKSLVEPPPSDMTPKP